MDKYTVDLDKVLNDFEYSELTDQYSVGASSQPLNNVHNSSAQRQSDLYKLRNPPIKHTINNVFQSLNEYLNTDIGAKIKQNEFNNIKDTNIVAVQEGSINPRQGFSLSNTEECVGNTNDQTQSFINVDNNIIPVNYLSANHDDEVVVETSRDELLESVSKENVPQQTGGTFEQNFPTEEEGFEFNFKTSIEDTLKLENLSVNSYEAESGYEKVQKIEIINPELNNVKDTYSEVKDNYPETKENHLETKKDYPETKVDVETKQNFPDVLETKQNHLETKDVAETNELIPILQVEEINKEPQTTTTTNTVVGFDESFGLNESELHHYLDELENEYESKDNNQIIEAVIEEQPTEKKVTQIKQIPAVEVTVSVSNNDQSDIINQETEEVDDNNDAAAASRPSSLQINNQNQIDLVGEPGSTPYNNMYISKTLPVTTTTTTTEVVPESDSGESSPSVSPTFSDVSTDTAGSTATTESVTDSIEAPKLLENIENNLNDSSTTNNTLNIENISNNNVNVNNESYESNETACVSEVLVANNDDDIGLESTNRDETIGDVHSAGGANISVDLETNINPPEVVLEQNSGPSSWLGKQAPLWIPDSEALNCLHCDTKFTVIKRRHHCRACGLVLCSKCCNMKLRLEYLDAEARVCLRCYDILNRDTNSSSGSEVSPSSGNSPNHRQQLNQPNPNNPMEYCSMVPPLQQVSGSSQNPPTVMVPIGVLKRKGSSKSRTNKSVMFCDGIRPGSELTNLDNDFNYNESRSSNSKKGSSPPPPKANRNTPAIDPTSKSFIPNAENSLPPTVTVFKSDITYTECANNASVVEMLQNEPLTFALKSNLHVHVKIINMDCCINKSAWCFSTEGMITVGQDEIVLLLEFIDNEKTVPKDMFYHINSIYNDAKKGTSITEYGISLHGTTNFLESKNHIGFLYIRPTFQCLQNVIVPKEPYLIGILVHRWEMPWAKIFPLRLILRLGAEYRYYPSPIISTRQRESVFVEIGHTIINLLADFRNFSYTLPNIRGLTIHMEEKNTTVTIPTNRYDQVMKSISNSSDHILAFGGNFSTKADSHLVCIQDTHGNNENTYTTHAINIHNRPRKVTGASFIVFNGALKSSSGLTAKSSIVEDGLMIQIPPEHMIQIRETLRQMKNYTIQCGCINATSDESVNIIWGENDVNFNTGVLSSIDNQPLGGIPSIRVHNGKDYVCSSGNRMIRWTEVFIMQNGDENARGQDVDFSKLAESISKATCQALVKYLDLLSSNNFNKIGIRTTLHVENVSYSAGSNGMKLPPIYMKSLDNELIPVLHRITSNNLGENAIVLELVFRILNV